MRYNYFKAIPLSFYAPALYKDVAWRWGGIASMYLLFILTLTTLPGLYNMFGMHGQINSITTKDSNFKALIEQFPTVTVTGGNVSIDKPSPYAIRDPATNQPLIVFDTANQIKTIDNFQHGIIINQTNIIIKQKDGEVRIYPLKEGHNFTLDKQQLEKFYDLRWAWVFAIILPLMIVGAWVFRIVLAAVFAIFGILLGYTLKAKMHYQQYVRIAAVAFTPALIVGTIFNLLNLNLNSETLILFIISVVYMTFGVFVNRGLKAESESEKSDDRALDL